MKIEMKIEPSREFKAFYTIFCIVWGVSALALMFSGIEIRLPNDISPHMIRYTLAFLTLAIGAMAVGVMPLILIWEYVTSTSTD